MNALELRIEPSPCMHICIPSAMFNILNILTWFNCTVNAVFLFYISSKIIISIRTVALAYKTSLVLQAQGARRALVGDYDTLP